MRARPPAARAPGARCRAPAARRGVPRGLLEPTDPETLLFTGFAIARPLLARGLAGDQIAHRLWISPHTVRDHTRAVYAKLAFANRHELTAKLFLDHHMPTFDADSTCEFSPTPTAS